MNFAKKLYCRAFQKVFHIALPMLPYRNPKILNSMREIPGILRGEGCKHPLLVTDKTVMGLGLAQPLIDACAAAGMPLAVFDQVLPNPTASLVERCTRAYRAAGCDCLIAMGGGSPMDTAKATGVRIAKPRASLASLEGILKLGHAKLPPIVAIPTTAGTGSETTLAAIIVDDETRHKYCINDFPLIPPYAVLDPATTATLPPIIAASSGLDALTHAVEAYIGRSTTKETRDYAEKAVRLIFDNIYGAVNHESEDAERHMLHASHYAGRAFTRSYVGYIHAVSHSLSGRYNVPHGLANAVLLPLVLEMYGECVHKKLAALARVAGLDRQEGVGTSDAALAKAFIAAIRQMNRDFGIPETLPGIELGAIPEMARYAEKEANPLYPVPVLWDAKKLETIYRAVRDKRYFAEEAPAEQPDKGQQFAQLVAEQRAYFQTGATLEIARRKAKLRRLLQAIEERETEIFAALRSDLGKGASESYMCEVALVKSEINYMLRHVSGLAKEKRVKTPLVQYISRSYVKPSPRGCVLIMSPWNYPFLLTIDPLVDAIAAGNTAVVKPSAYSPATSALIAELLAEVFERREVAVVTGGRAENAMLLEQKFDYIFFTGSKAVGSLVLEKAAPHLTPCTLELGGKSPCIVDSSAKIELAARRIVFGKLINAGQTCVAPDYIYCDYRIKDQLVQAITREIQRQYGANPLTNREYGHIVNEKHYARLMGLIDPEKVVWGGEGDPETRKIAPTVLDNVSWDDAVMGEEIFGPILPILTWKRLDEAMETINNMPTPLALYYFTENSKQAKRVMSRVAFGGGCINDTIIHIATTAMGFGGSGESGMGSYHGRRGFETFSHRKSIVDKKTFLDLPMRYAPATGWKDKMVRMFLK